MSPTVHTAAPGQQHYLAIAHRDRLEDRLQSACRRGGDVPALISAANGSSVSFAELDRASRRIAAALAAARHRVAHAKTECPSSVQDLQLGRLSLAPTRRTTIGLAFQSTSASAVAAIACWHAGFPVAFLDMDGVGEPLQVDMCCVILTDTVELKARHCSAIILLCDDLMAPDSTSCNASDPCHACSAYVEEDIMYAVLTSGSTGQPRAVLGHYAGFLNRADWACGHPVVSYRPADVGCCVTRTTFVDALTQLFEPLLAGCPVLVFEPRQVLRIDDMCAQLAAHRVTRMTAVPSLLRMLVQHCSPMQWGALCLRCVISSGEPLSWQLAASLCTALPRVDLFNVYGTSEVAADCCWYHVSAIATGDGLVPLGTPLPGFNLFGDPISGEICVSGVGLCRSVIGNGDSGLEQNPVNGDWYFRTGDIGFCLDGNWHFVGRADRVVKFHGVRVSLAAIDGALHSCLEVADGIALVVSMGDEQRIVAVVVVTAERDDNSLLQSAFQPVSSALRTSVLAHLSSVFAISHVYRYTRASFPLNRNGKTDVRAVQLEFDEWMRTLEAALCPAPPRIDHTALLDTVQSEVSLALHRTVGHDVDYVSAGGDSILAIQVAHSLSLRIGWRVPSSWLLASPSMHELVARILAAIDEDGLTRQFVPDSITASESARSSSSAADGLVADAVTNAVVLTRASGHYRTDAAFDSPALMSNARSGFQLPRCISPTALMSASLSFDFSSGGIESTTRCLTQSSKTAVAALDSVHLVKCVDASPILVCCASASECSVERRCIVGSHAGLLCCVALGDGSGGMRELWSTALPHRIEGAAAVSSNGSVVFVGCHDGGLYAIGVADGAIRDVYFAPPRVSSSAASSAASADALEWTSLVGSDSHCAAHTHSTAVKSSPLPFELDGLDFVAYGDYSSNICILHFADDACMAETDDENNDVLGSSASVGRKRKVDNGLALGARLPHKHGRMAKIKARVFSDACLAFSGGSIFAAPLWSAKHRCAYFVSNVGFVTCLHLARGGSESCSSRLPCVQRVWSLALHSPVFASPVFVGGTSGAEPRDSIGIVTIGGRLVLIDAHIGNQLFSVDLGMGALFASPTLVPDSRVMLIPTHSGHIVAFDTALGREVCRIVSSDAQSIATSPTFQQRLRSLHPSDGSLQLATETSRLMCFCSVGGCLQFGVVTAAAGFEALFSIAVGAPVFSSPVWCGDEVVFGARDDRLHCVRCVGALVTRARTDANTSSSGGDASAAIASADTRTCNGGF